MTMMNSQVRVQEDKVNIKSLLPETNGAFTSHILPFFIYFFFFRTELAHSKGSKTTHYIKSKYRHLCRYHNVMQIYVYEFLSLLR